MAAEVSSLFRVLKEHSTEEHQMKSTEASNGKSSKALFTRDLLGGCSSFSASASASSSSLLGSKELDLDLQVPTGWEKRLDMKSGKVYLKRCNSPISSSSSSDQQDQQQPQQKKSRKSVEIQDLNLFPPLSLSSKNLAVEESLLDRKSPTVLPSNYQSVCTLDKVKFALERAEKESSSKKRLLMHPSDGVAVGVSSSSSSSLSLTKEEDDEDNRLSSLSSPLKTISSASSEGVLFAAGCPGCLFYVLISKISPKCPRCNSVVPLPAPKKPRIDLNISI